MLAAVNRSGFARSHGLTQLVERLSSESDPASYDQLQKLFCEVLGERYQLTCHVWGYLKSHLAKKDDAKDLWSRLVCIGFAKDTQKLSGLCEELAKTVQSTCTRRSMEDAFFRVWVAAMSEPCFRRAQLF